MDKVRLGIVGYGIIGAQHAASVFGGQTPRLTLGAICTRSAAGQAAARAACPGVPVFADAQTLFDSGACDAVLLATPHYDHPPQAISAFAHGLHVLTEKPAGVYTAQVRRMNEAAARSGKVFAIMYNQRTDPVYQTLRQALQDGGLGAVKRVTWIVTHWYRSQAYHDASPWHSTWAGDGGGVLINQSIHQLDLWQWMFGVPDRVWARAGFGRYFDIEVEDDVMAYFSYDGGPTGEYITSLGEAPGTNRLEVACDMGKLVVENGRLRFWRNEMSERAFNRINTLPFGLPACEEQELAVSPPGAGAHTAILNNFADAILDGAPLLAPGEEGLRALTLSNAILLSAWTGEEVATRPFDDDRFARLLQAKAEAGRRKGAL